MSPVTRRLAALGQKTSGAAAPAAIAALFIVVALQTGRTDRAVGELQRLAPVQRQAQIASCERGNIVRWEINKRSENLKVLRRALLDFFVETRRSRADLHGTSYDPHFVRVVDRLTPQLEDLSTGTIPLADCDKLYPAAPK